MVGSPSGLTMKAFSLMKNDFCIEYGESEGEIDHQFNHYTRDIFDISTFKTNIKTAIEAAQRALTRTVVSLPRPGTLVVLRLSQGTRKTLLGRRRDGHTGTFPRIF